MTEYKAILKAFCGRSRQELVQTESMSTISLCYSTKLNTAMNGKKIPVLNIGDLKKKVFDGPHHSYVWSIAELYGKLRKFIGIPKNVCDNSKSCVRVKEIEMGFLIKTGELDNETLCRFYLPT